MRLSLVKQLVYISARITLLKNVTYYKNTLAFPVQKQILYFLTNRSYNFNMKNVCLILGACYNPISYIRNR